MKKLACVTAALGALVMIGVGGPASAAMGQCFDAHGRPVGPPHDTDNPPYGMICSIYAQGGQCTHVQPGWAESNCAYAPRYRSQYHYDPKPDYGYKRQYDKPQGRDARHSKPSDPTKYIKHPDPTHPPYSLGPPNTAN